MDYLTGSRWLKALSNMEQTIAMENKFYLNYRCYLTYIGIVIINLDTIHFTLDGLFNTAKCTFKLLANCKVDITFSEKREFKKISKC